MSAFDFLYCPQSIAVIGASRTQDEIHPVHPPAEEILGRADPSLHD